jgi:hypothetical protein
VTTHRELTETLLEAKQNGDFFETLLGLARLQMDARTQFSESLAAVHNSGAIDLVAEYATLRNEPIVSDFFLTRHVFESVLPELEAPSAAVAKTVAHLVTQAGNDLASHSPIEAFRSFLSKKSERPQETISAIEADPSTLALLLPVVAAVGFDCDRAYFTEKLVNLTGSPVDVLQRMAVFSLGNASMEEQDGRLPTRVLETLEGVFDKTDRDETFAAALSAAVALIPKDRSAYDRLLEVIRKALEIGGEWTLYAAARAFAYETKTLGRSLIALVSEHLKAKATDNGQLWQWIDFGVSSLLESDDRDVALPVLEEVLKRFPSSAELKQFQCCQGTIDSSPGLRSYIVTRWLASGDMALSKAAGDAVQHAHRDDIVINADPSALGATDEATLVFIAHRAAGYLFFWPTAAASFLISLMRLGAIAPIQQLLLDPLLLNYTGSVRQLLESRLQAEPEPVAAAIQACLAKIDAYLKDVQAAAGVRELRVSTEHRATFHKALNQKMSNSFEAARKEMPLLSLVKRSIVLYGRGAVQHVARQDGTAHRADMMFKTLGTELSFPRMSQIDELGLHLRLRILRAWKRAQ